MPDSIAAPIPAPAADALTRVRAALATPEAVDLAAPILRRDLADLTGRLALVRLRADPRAAPAAFSPDVGRLLARLEAGAGLAAGTLH
ncbi:MAG: hypothetical protein IMZ44_07625 [Planctomycetes bacterium]|nr:hypothetical protein [Planctomycetota bacterium]